MEGMEGMTREADAARALKRVVTSHDAPSGTGPYSPALVVGDLVLVSGQGPLDPQTHEIRGKDIAEQTILTFANVAALLKAAGSSLEDVVKVNVYLSDMGNYHSFNAVYGDLFKEPYPVRTTVACGLLDILIEVDCLAMVSRVP
jgi:2-iminobutanoate/2-iminopropanoate deaminase